DEKRKAGVEAKNQADSVLHSSEKALAEHGDKVGEAERTAIQTAIDELKGVIEGGDAEVISSKTQALIQASMKLGEAMYNAQNTAGQDGAQPASEAHSDDVVDAEFEEVNGDEKKSA
ncbi:MAG: dnaK, partial [Phenylobacterium sp.]|nr:dnaK [Phenylobacterium sp.]